MAERANYTWTMFGQDLALMSHVTMYEANTIGHSLEAAGIHPYDALPIMNRMLAVVDVKQAGVFASNIGLLIKKGSESAG